ncbi:MAG: class I SAM-dependent methyltransferase [Planctomycetota bacterium]|jgi:tellurite methyltransferase|nr:class I SAM-dependent methyltransferase [Planctomycetota bacterium]
MSVPAAWAPLRHADIYLIDHVLRGTIQPGDTVADLGCGGGRNLAVLAEIGCSVTFVDADPAAVTAASRLAECLPGLHRALVGSLPDLDLEHSCDVVLSNAVLHFAPNQTQFHAWADACWRQLAPGGVFLARLSTRIGLPDAKPPGFRYLADGADIADCEQRWGAERIDPLKTTLVDELRTMTTWALRRPR